MAPQSSTKTRAHTIWSEKRLVGICLFISLAQFQYGYDSAAVSGFQSMPGFLAIFGYVDPTNPIGYNLTTKVQTLIQSLMNVGALVCCLVMFKFGGHISPRTGLWAASFFGAVSIATQIGSEHLAALYVGRVLLGISNGFFSTYSVIYIGESAPAYLRGAAIGMVAFQIYFGSLIGILVDNYTHVHTGRKSYQIPLGVMFVVPLLISTALFFLPETPRYYVATGQEDKAAAAIRKLRGVKDEVQLRKDVAIMKNAWLQELETGSSVDLLDAFRGTDLRRTLLTIAVALGQAASGMFFMSAFSVYFFVQAHVGKPFTWVTVSLAIALSGTILSFPAVRFLDRRHLLIGSSCVNFAVMLTIAIIYTVVPGSQASGEVLIGLTCIFVWMYGFGQGPVLWALQTEIPSQRFRSQTIGLSQGVSFVASWVTSYCSPYFINPEALDWGPKYLYIWGCSNLILAVFVFFFVPETRGRSLEQLDELFSKRVPARKFKAYVTDLQQVDADDYIEEITLDEKVEVA
ncbi:general substrate transporter [Staphylotrichum tortipilum]|uniref:General substrate transporter n=1 Tax=Staphylotrichum tortipilum TaxID=2831512 RepID=A0AAN6MFG7_9PEZI|nr:general substrate transporter [Staphylotrichum longicolle]